MIIIPVIACAQTMTDSSFTDLDPVEFYVNMKLNDNKVVLDIRTQKEYRKERIPGAVLAENREILLSFCDTLDIDQPLFVYCSDNYRSPVACQLLIEKGFRHVFNLRDGLSEWVKSGLETDKKRIRSLKSKD
jgi:rhodanese-related sulfurtransferase